MSPSLRLRPAAILAIEDIAVDGTRCSAEIDLNRYLGNREGCFDSSGLMFASSARGISLRGRVLLAELMSSAGHWSYDEIAIRVQLSSSEHETAPILSLDKSELAIENAWAEAQTAASLAMTDNSMCRNLRLRGGTNLVALCRISTHGNTDISGEYRKRWLSLDSILGNNNGHFDPSGAGLTKSARNIRIVGYNLEAELQSVDGQWQTNHIDLRRLLSCSDGRLHAATQPRETAFSRISRNDNPDSIDYEIVASPTLYTRLEDPAKMIRLCFIHPGEWHDQLHCSTTNVYMSTAPAYRCLSYRWGVDQASEMLQINGHDVRITANLAQALRRLRSHGVVDAVWVDFLSIDQSNPAEKNVQVTLMAHIFQGAHGVLVWIGDDGADDDSIQQNRRIGPTIGETLADAFDSLADDGPASQLLNICTSITLSQDGETSYGPYTRRLAVALERFVGAEWWGRAWTIQELMLNEQATLLFGAASIPWTVFTEAHKSLDHQLRQHDLIADADSAAGLAGVTEHNLTALLRRLVEQLWRFKNMLNDRNRAKRSDLGIAASRDHALLVLHHCRSQRSTDKRDKLFAFYSVAREAFIGVQPDYRIGTAKLYQTFTLRLIENMEHFDVWAFLDFENHDSAETCASKLPSWVIDWSCPPKHRLAYSLRFRFRDDRTLRPVASRGKSLCQVTPDGGLLVHARRLGTMLRLTETMYTSLNTWSRSKWDQPPWDKLTHILREWQSFLHLSNMTEHGKNVEVMHRMWHLMIGRGVNYNLEGSHLGVPTLFDKVVAMIGDESAFQDWWARHLHQWNEIPDDARPQNDEEGFITQRTMFRAEGRRLFISSDGILGLAPSQSQPGDRLYYVDGCRWPVVLRPQSDDSGEAEKGLQLVGTCLIETSYGCEDPEAQFHDILLK